MEAVQALLCNFLLDQTEYINKRQRGISRVLTPEIQASMKPIYAACSQLNGPGCFQRMKALMQKHVQSQKGAMFNGATDTLRQQLDLLQSYIRASYECLVQELTKSLTMQFEPMLKPVQKNDRIIPDLVTICAQISKLCKLSCVDYVLPNLSQPDNGSVPASPGKELPLKRELSEGPNPPKFLGKCNVIRIGTVPLPHTNPIQISVQEITITMTGSQEALIVLNKPQDPSSFHSLIELISAQRGGTPWFRELSLQQGREKLESLGVYYTARVSPRDSCMLEDLQYEDEEMTPEAPRSSLPSDQPAIFTLAQQPLLPGVRLYPCGRKREGRRDPVTLGEEAQRQSHGTKPRRGACWVPLPSQHVPVQLVMADRPPWHSSPRAPAECAPEGRGWNAAFLPGAPLPEAPHSSRVTGKHERDPLAIPSVAGVLHVRAREGVWGKWQNASAREDGSSDVDEKEACGDTHTANDS